MMMMMMTTSSNSLFGLDDMEALLWGPSCPTADPLGSPLLHPDTPEDGGETFAEGAGGASPLSLSPLSSSSSSSSPPPLYSPPPALLQRDKADNEEEEEEEEEEDLLALPWLGHAGGRPHSGKVDAFSGLDWMSERMDLREFDLDSLIGSCSPCDESPVSPDDLLSSLDCPMDLDDLSLPSLPTPTLPLPPPPPPAPLPSPPASAPSTPASASHDGRQEVPLSPPMFVPEPQEELEIKSEPISPPSPSYTLDLGSEVDVTECEVKPAAPPAVPQVPRIILSLSTTRIVVLLAPKAEERAPNSTVTAPPVIRAAPPVSAVTRTPRSRPYPEPKFRPVPAALATTSTATSSTTAAQSTTSPKTKPSSSEGDAGGGGGGGRAKGAERPPKEKKLKKMEQNKTAATRYRQKKRAEHDHLHTEYTALENRNGELKETADSLAREIQYLKELMEEVRVAKLGNGSGC